MRDELLPTRSTTRTSPKTACPHHHSQHDQRQRGRLHGAREMPAARTAGQTTVVTASERGDRVEHGGPQRWPHPRHSTVCPPCCMLRCATLLDDRVDMASDLEAGSTAHSPPRSGGLPPATSTTMCGVHQTGCTDNSTLSTRRGRHGSITMSPCSTIGCGSWRDMKAAEGRRRSPNFYSQVHS